MPINVKLPPEPFTTEANRDSTQLFAHCEAHDRLIGEIRRYMNGAIGGRSFLISGHRGSGKTTLTFRAIQELRPAQAISDVTANVFRPVLVRINARDLVLRDKPSADDRQAMDVEGARTQNFLEQVTVALYRAVMKEYCDSAFLRIDEMKARHRADLYEVAAQFALDLERCPSTARLRAFWDRMGRLERGILFPAATRQSQGVLEIRALNCACEAYQVISGIWEQKISSNEKADQRQEIERTLKLKSRDLFNKLIGLASGTAAGVALAKVNLAWAIAVGVLTQITISTALTFSSKRSRQMSQEMDERFTLDRSRGSLGRMLPLLVAHFQDAGLAPVFVIDELDKITNIEQEMERLIPNLKLFVAEQAFFCFLTDRDYLERLRKTFRETAYPAAYTYFSDQLFVIYRPDELRLYLSKCFAQNTKLEPGEVVDLTVWPYLLSYRAKMHMIDLRREIEHICDRDGQVRIPPGIVTTAPLCRVQVTIQLAVEWVFFSREVQDRCAQSAEFTQIVYDTLYYPARAWEEDREFDTNMDVLVQVLTSRLKTNAAAQSESQLLIDDDDRRFLEQILLVLIQYLANPAQLVRDVQAAQASKTVPKGWQEVEQAVLDAMCKDALLERVEQTTYRWIRNRYGEPKGENSLRLDTVSDMQDIERLQTFLSDSFGPDVDLTAMAAEYGVLSTTPAWSQVEAALLRLRKMEDPGNATRA